MTAQGPMTPDALEAFTVHATRTLELPPAAPPVPRGATFRALRNAGRDRLLTMTMSRDPDVRRMAGAELARRGR